MNDVDGTARRVLPPEQLDHRIDGDQLIGPHQQQRENRALLPRACIQLGLAAQRPHRAEQTELNVHWPDHAT
jgi:hypothetical protein